MSPGQTGHITGQMGCVPGTDGTHTRGCPAKILYVYWFFSFPIWQSRKPNVHFGLKRSILVHLGPPTALWPFLIKPTTHAQVSILFGATLRYVDMVHLCLALSSGISKPTVC